MSKWIRIATVVWVGLALTLAFDAVSDDTAKKTAAIHVAHPDADAKAEVKAEATEVQLSSCMPVYRPPRLGKPRMTVGGGSRGPGKGFPGLYVLVPDHVGLTTSPQPSLFWFVDQVPPAGTQFVFTLMDEEADMPLVEKALTLPRSAGLQRIRISDYGVQLESGVEYQWSIAMSAAGADHSKDVVSMGFIDYIGKSDEIAARLAADGADGSASVFADEGIWYDAMTSIDDSIGRDSSAMDFTVARAGLLKGAGLDAVAMHILQ